MLVMVAWWRGIPQPTTGICRNIIKFIGFPAASRDPPMPTYSQHKYVA